MKLFELVNLSEGWAQRAIQQGGQPGTEYYWDEGQQGDTGDIKDRMPHAPVRGNKPSKPKQTGTDNLSYSSWRESEEFAPYRDDNKYQTTVRAYYGFKLLRGEGDVDLQIYRKLLDALKGRNNRRFETDSKQRLMKQAAQTVIKQIEYYESGRTNAIIIPTPSTAPLAGQWATVLAQEMNASGRFSAEVRNVLEYNPKYKYGLLAGDPNKVNPQALRANIEVYSDIIVDEFVREFRSFDDAYETIIQAMEWARNRVRQNPEDQLAQIDLQATQLAYNELERLMGLPEEEFEVLRHRAIEARGNTPRRFHDLYGGLRRTVWDKTRVTPGIDFGGVPNNSLIIIADDNIESGSMLVDTYRMLYKNGLVDKRRTRVVGAVMHNLNVK